MTLGPSSVEVMTVQSGTVYEQQFSFARVRASKASGLYGTQPRLWHAMYRT